MLRYNIRNLGKVAATINGYNTLTLTVSAPMLMNADGNAFNIILPAASSSTAGYMSVSDKLKLDSLPVFENLASVSEGTELSLVTTGDKYRWNAAETKLNGIEAEANKYVHPASVAGAKSSGLYKITTDTNGHVTAATEVAKADITALGIPESDTTYDEATTSSNGLMSSSDKSKLDGIAANANNYSLPDATTSAKGGVIIGTNISVSNGTISVDNASTSTKGVAQLSNSTNSDSESLAATPKAVKTVNDSLSTHTSNTSNPHSVTKSQVGLGNVANIDQSKAIATITRNGTTYTYTCLDGTTGTFTQQDNDTVYSIATASANGLMSSADKSKLDQMNVPSILTGTLTIPATGWSSDSNAMYPKYIDVSVTNCTADHFPQINVLIDYMATSANAGLCPLVETKSGAIRFRSQNVPTGAIQASYRLEKF